MEIAPAYNIRVTSIQQGTVATELQQHTTAEKHKAEMQKSKNNMSHLAPENIAESMVYALEAPDGVDVSVYSILY